MKRIYFVLLFVLVAACSKSTDSSNPTKSKSDLLINKKWKTVAIKAKLADGSIYDEDMSKRKDYDNDDYYLFKGDLTFGIYANTLKEPGNDKEILEAGTWKLINGDTYLELRSNNSTPGQTVTYFPTKIISISENFMKWEVQDNMDQTLWIDFNPIQ